jgi:hypothetical protein
MSASAYREEWAAKLHKRPDEIYVPLALRETESDPWDELAEAELDVRSRWEATGRKPVS